MRGRKTDKHNVQSKTKKRGRWRVMWIVSKRARMGDERSVKWGVGCRGTIDT